MEQAKTKSKFRLWLEKICEKIGEDCKTKNADFKYIFLKCLILSLGLLISLFWGPFAYVVLVMACVFAGFQCNGRSLYYIVFLMPLMQIFRNKPSDSYFLIYLSVFVIALLGVKLLIDIIKKKKKINWFFTIMFVLVALYISMPFQNFGLRYWGSLMLGVLLVFVGYYYKDDMCFKELAFVFALSVFMTAFFEVFRNITRLNDLVGLAYSYGVKLSGASINPNVLMGESMLALGLLIVLYLGGQINLLFYPMLVIYPTITLLTVSKVGLMDLVIVGALFLIVLFVKGISKKTIKKNLLRTVVCVLLIACSFLICLNQVKSLFNRFSDVTDNKENISEDVGRDTTNDSVINIGDKTFNLTEFTTGRFDIWKSYLKKIFDSPKSALFGYGVGAPFIGEWQGRKDWQPHNTIIQGLYYVGIVGLLLMVVWWFSALDKKKFKELNWFALIALIGLGIYLCDAEFFSFRLGVYILLLSFSFAPVKKEVETKAEEKEVDENKIPKIIHYIWLGGNPLPKIAEECIESWKKYCPDYEIKRWDESNLNIDCCEYCRQAYDAKKYAFASDVARFDVLYKEGGIYLDIDVKLLKPLDEFLVNECFMGFEHKEALAPGLIMGCAKGNSVVAELFDSYKNDKFVLENGELNLKTICIRTTDYLVDKGLQLDNTRQNVGGVEVYPTEYFCPLSPITNKKEITDNTYAIHLYYSSWYSKKAKLKKFTKKTLNFITNGYFGIWLYEYKKRKSA